MDKPQEYISLSESTDHLKRHFSGAITVGSKFFANSQQRIVDKAEAALMEKFFEAQDAGENAGRVVITINFDKPIGTDALVNLEGHKNTVKIIRDEGEAHQSTVTAVETESPPETTKLTIIAGPYGPSGKWGIYTMFPGNEAPAFPNEKQPEDIRRENEKFWEGHGFLATKDEINSHPRADGKPHINNNEGAKPKENKKPKP